MCTVLKRRQEKLPPGALVVPIILSSDKTKLSTFSGDKEAWPVYLTIGNIEKKIRRKVNTRAMILVGYIPVCKLRCFSAKQRSAEGHQLFHECMRRLLAPLVEAGVNGVKMVCADSFVQKAYPILSAYIADYPEQCLVVGCKENSCPRCTVDPKKRGEQVHSVERDPEKTKHILAQKSRGENPKEFNELSLCPIKPFWMNLPHCNIFTCITPDILHQLHKGIFKDHIVQWATEAMPNGSAEIDQRFRTMTLHPTLRHFKNGITLTSQWTGTEHKNMEKVFLGVLANATDPTVIRAVRAILDFIYYAHFEIHTDESLALMDTAWRTFHENKEIFIRLDIQKHFNISKLHNIKHYIDLIRSHGTADGFNTENTERLHIDLAKLGYRSTNKKGYIKQMTLWLQRQDAIHRFSSYLRWRMPGYVGELAEGLDGEDKDEDEEIDEEGDLTMKDAAEEPIRRTLHQTPKQPSLPRVSIASIMQDFGAADFLVHLTSFLKARRDIANHASALLSEHSVFPVYCRLTLRLPPISKVSCSNEPINDTVIATKYKPGRVTTRGVKTAVPACFSVVLVRDPADLGGRGSTPNPHNGVLQ